MAFIQLPCLLPCLFIRQFLRGRLRVIPSHGFIMTTNQTRTTRVCARVDPETHERITRAAEFSGRSMNQFLVDAATKMAKEVVGEATTIRLTNEEADRMMEVLNNSHPANTRLREAARRHADRKYRHKPQKSG